MKKIKNLILLVFVMVITKSSVAQMDTAIQNKAVNWVAALQLNDNAKAKKVQDAIITHLTAVRDWHNSNPYTLVPEGINPTTGNKLSEMDRQVIICSAKPKSIHDNLMAVLQTELDSAQVEMILDKYT